MIWTKDTHQSTSFRLSTAHMKFHQICTLIESFCWQEFGEFWHEHSKFSKFLLWLVLFVQNIVRLTWKIPEWKSPVSFMTLKSDAKFEEKLTCGLENDIRSRPNFNQSNWKISKLGLYRTFFPKKNMYKLKICRGVMSHDNEEWCKIWRGIDLSFQHYHEEFDEFWPELLKVSKIGTFNGLLLNKVYNVWAKKSTEE